jgi:hypothetical protein
MEFKKVKIKDIKDNPFKKYIEDGNLNEEIIESLIEGYKQTFFHENIAGRYNKKGEIELIYGHHRLEALKRLYGLNYMINIKIYTYKEFDDEKMLIDMVRENLTQRGTDYKELSHSIILVKRWLEGILFNPKAKPKKVTTGDISKFISKTGKAISTDRVRTLLEIEYNLDENIKKNVIITPRGSKAKDNDVGIDIAHNLSKIKKNEQEHILLHIKKSGINKDKARRLITEYKESDDSVKKKVLKGKLELADIGIENMKAIMKKKSDNKENENKQLKIIPYKKYLNEASGKVAKANVEIYQACSILYGLEKSGILYDLDWNEVKKILEQAKERSEEYSKFITKLMERF